MQDGQDMAWLSIRAAVKLLTSCSPDPGVACHIRSLHAGSALHTLHPHATCLTSRTVQQNNTSTTPLAARLPPSGGGLPAMLRRSAELGPHHSPSPRGNYLDDIQCDHPRAACTVQLSGCIYIGILRHEGKLQMSPISLL